jgi:hypothetical protein
MQNQKDGQHNDKRRIVFLVALLFARRESFLKKKFAHNGCDAADSSGPEKVFNPNPKTSVEVEQRWRRPILWNEQKTGERQRSSHRSAPNDLRAVSLSDEIAGQPCGVEKKRPDEVRELVVHGYSPYISGDFSRDFVASFFS